MGRRWLGDPESFRLQQAWIAAQVLWITWLLFDADGWQFATGVVLVVLGAALIVVLEVQCRRRNVTGQ